MRRKIVLHCDGCGETWADYEYMLGKKCSETYGPAEAVVRWATPQEEAAWQQEAL